MNSPLTLRLAALVFSAAPAGAAIKTWDGSTSGNWSTTANWTTSPVPAAADDLVFPVGGANKAMTNNLASGLAFKTLAFAEGGYSIAGNPFSITATASVTTAISCSHDTGTVTVSVPVTLSANTCSVNNLGDGTLTFAATSGINLNTEHLILTATGPVNMTGAITGTGAAVALTKNNPGVLTLSATNTFTGNTGIDGGTVVLNGSLSGGGTVTLSTASATLAGNNGTIAGATTVNGIISPGTTTAGSRGDLTFNGNLTFNAAGSAVFDMTASTTTPGSSYDQLVCGGATVTAGTAQLTFNLTGVPALGTEYILLSKTSAGAITGTFHDAADANIAEGSIRSVGLVRMQFSYAGGDGNDFTATVVPVTASAGSKAWDDGAADAADHNFSTGDNWNANGVPPAGSTLVFGTAAPLADRALVKNDTGGHFYEIQFTDTGYSITPESLTNQDVTLTNGINATATASGSNTWAVDAHLANAQTFSNLGSGTVTVSATLSLEGQDLTLHSDNAGAAPSLRLNGYVEGTGRIIKTGTDLVEFAGSGATNWGHTGEVVVQQGELRITRTVIVAPAQVIQGPVTIGGAGFAASLTTTVPERILDTVGVTVNALGTFAPGAAETIGSLTLGGGTVNSGAVVVAVNGDITANESATIPSPLQVNTPVRTWTVAAARTLTLSGALTYSPLTSGTSVLKQGPGTLVLSGTSAITTYSVDAGILDLEINSLTNTIGVFINGGTLAGNGQAVRITSSAPGGTISPGTGTGSAVLRCSRLTLNSATTAAFDLNGTTTGTGYDQLDVAALPGVDASGNSVTLNNAVLLLRDPAVLPDGSVLTLIRNDGTDAVIGTFAGLAQGATVRTAVNQYTISYTGGTGNDVTLTSVLPSPTGTTKVWSGATSASWGTATNWVGGVVPFAGDSLVFPGDAARLTNANDLPANVTFNSINYTGAMPSGSPTVSGNPVRLLQSLECAWTGSTGNLTFSPGLTLAAASAAIRNTGTLRLQFNGTVIVNGSSLVLSGDGGATLRRMTLAGGLSIAGSGALFIRENADVTLSGGATSSFGTTTVEFGRLASSGGVVKIPGPLILGDGVHPVTSNFDSSTIAVAQPVTVNAGATFQGFGNSLASLTINGGALNLTGEMGVLGNVTVNSGSVVTPNGLFFSPTAAPHLVQVAAGASLTMQNVRSQPGGTDLLEKLGGGTFTVQSSLLDVETIDLTAGTLRMDAPNGTGAGCYIQGGTLTGTGHWGAISGSGSGIVAPGASPGILTANSFNGFPGLTLNMEISGTLPGVHHDQISMGLGHGQSTTLNLTLTGGYVPLTGQVLRLVDNTGASQFLAPYAGIAEGSTRSLGGGVTVQFSYLGGTGNDFTATVTASPAGAFRVWDGGGADANWMTAANWTGDIAPLPQEALRFPNGALQPANSNNFAAATAFGALKMEGDYTFSGSSITLLGDVDAQSPGTVTLGNALIIPGARSILLSGAGHFQQSGIVTFSGTGSLAARNSGSGDINFIAGFNQTGAETDGGLIVESPGTGLVKLSTPNNSYEGDTWVRRGVLVLNASVSNLVPANLRIGGAGFTASVENPAGATNGRINNAADLIVEAGGTHILTGASPVERIARLVMRGGSLVQPAGGQLIVLDALRGEGPVPSTITTPVFVEAISGSDVDLVEVDPGASLTLAANIGNVGGLGFPRLRRLGSGTLILTATSNFTEFDAQAGVTILSTATGQINGPILINGGIITGNGTLFGAASGTAGGGTLTPSTAAGTGTGLLTCAGNLLPATATHIAIEIGGLTAVTQHDQLQVNGTLDLNRCIFDLSLTNGFIPTASQAFTILNKTSGGLPTPRPFAGKDEGVTFSAAGQLWKLTYTGGDGNDIVLTSQGPAPTLTLTTFAFGTPPGGAAGRQITATVTGPAGALVRLEASDDLSGWSIIGTATTSGAGAASFNLTDAAAGPRRFYRFSIP